MTTRISSLSVQYVEVDVTTDVDPTGNTVSMAFAPGGIEPGDTYEWQTAAWDGTATAVTAGYRATARVLVGTSTAVGALTDGDWHVWVKIVAGSETVVIDTGIVTVY